MGKFAIRVGDNHICPAVSGTVPHVGGPILPPGAMTVIIAGSPAAVVGDICTCTGPPSQIINGSSSVFITGKPAARLGDMSSHGGSLIGGCPTVLIGG
jgi:uncharacterized Zn-binding protein involved in type VI secretion